MDMKSKKKISFEIHSMVNVLKFWTLVACQKGLDKQGRPRAVWSGSSLFAILTSFLLIPVLIPIVLFENRNRKVFEILEHLPYFFGVRGGGGGGG